MVNLTVNGTARMFDGDEDMPLLWYLRDDLRLTGTRFGCGAGLCGACTVHLDGTAVRACQTPLKGLNNKKVVTIEGLESADGKLHPVQQAVVDEQGFQCAFCMSGFMMSTVGFLKTNPNPSREELAHGISGNLCRCADYNKILNAMMRGAENMRRA